MTAKHTQWIAITLAGAAFFLAYSFLPLTSPRTFNSPDERANFHFASLFAETGRLWFYEPLNDVGADRVHPRSMRVVDGFTVPGGFLGMPLFYGIAAKVFGLNSILYITPLLAVLAALAWGAVIGRWFGSQIGTAAGALLLAHPIWWYESSRTLMPNVPFLALTIFAVAMFVLRPISAAFGRHKYRSVLTPYLDDIIAGILAGMALFIRPSEIYWLIVADIAIIAVLYRQLPWKRLMVALASSLIVFAPMFLLNDVVYGDPLASGYGSAFAGAPTEQLPAGRGSRLFGSFTPYLFPLGLAPRTAIGNLLTYGLGFFPWWSALVAVSLIALAVEARRRRVLPKSAVAFAAAAAAVSCWLVLFYGSWTFHDNPNPDAVTIGSSYLRYWMPIFIFATVPVAWLLVSVIKRLQLRFRAAMTGTLLGLFAAVSAVTVFASPQEGLLAVRANLFAFEKTSAEIVALTPKNSLIVVDRADKFLFPERSVIVPLREEGTYESVSKLRHSVPIYYFGITFPESDLEHLNNMKLPPLGLSIELVKTLGEESLYRFVAK